MPEFALLISPKADAAFFERASEVALTEVMGVPGVSNVRLHQSGLLRFVHVVADDDTLPNEPPVFS